MGTILSQEEIEERLRSVEEIQERLRSVKEYDVQFPQKIITQHPGENPVFTASQTFTQAISPFRISDRIANNYFPTFESIHEQFILLLRQSLSNMLQRRVAGIVRCTEIIKYHEFLKELSRTSDLHLFSLNPLPGEAMVIFEDRLVFSLVYWMSGGTDSLDIKTEGRSYTKMEEILVRHFAQTTFRDLQQIWRSVLPVQMQWRPFAGLTDYLQICPSKELLLVIKMDIEIDHAPMDMTLCYPFSMIEPILPLLKSSWTSGFHFWSWRSHVCNHLNRLPVTVSLKVEPAPLSFQQLQALKPGEILPLNQSPASALELRINRTPKGAVELQAQPHREYTLTVPPNRLEDLEVDLKVVVGKANLSLDTLVQLQEGSVIVLDRFQQDPEVDILLEHIPVAQGTPFILNRAYVVHLTSILPCEDSQKTIPDLFIRGSFNEWRSDPAWKLFPINLTQSVARVSLEAGSYEFRIADPCWSENHDFGVLGDALLKAQGQPAALIPKGSNLHLEIPHTGFWWFVLNRQKPSLQVMAHTDQETLKHATLSTLPLYMRHPPFPDDIKQKFPLPHEILTDLQRHPQKALQYIKPLLNEFSKEALLRLRKKNLFRIIVPTPEEKPVTLNPKESNSPPTSQSADSVVPSQEEAKPADELDNFFTDVYLLDDLSVEEKAGKETAKKTDLKTAELDKVEEKTGRKRNLVNPFVRFFKKLRGMNNSNLNMK
ncbi:MAG: FliM/FliN family flagellar motor switch protein [SAR324 cluster bacterium]|nr:FliM/FliN family flagellar motor switch protein [SAR324 cluster bacterium]